MNIAIMQLASWGDVILSTCIADAIKKFKPDWKVTYVTSSICKDALKNNPSIDDIKVIQVKSKVEAFGIWGDVTKEISPQFDKVVIPWAGILPPQNWRLLHNHVGGNNFMWAYPRAIQELGIPFSGKIKTYLYPTQEEFDKVDKFLKSFSRTDYRMIMMEVSGESGQTHWNPKWTEEAVKMLCSVYKKLHLFISHGGPEPAYISKLREYTNNTQLIHYMGRYSIREMSILFNYCNVMFSVSSGTANACMTHLCKHEIQWFELVNAGHWDSTPMWHNNNKSIFYTNQPSVYFAQVKKLLHGV